MNRFAKFLTSVVLALSVAGLSSAADFTVPHQYRGLDYPYIPGSPVYTKAPRGYRPFYVSHYGRHGSRFAYNAIFYNQTYTLFHTASEQGNLTPEGKGLAERVFEAYPYLMQNVGLLSDKGREQHAGIAKRMYANFPEAFKDGAFVYAVSSNSMRSVMSMAAFGASLQGCNPELHLKMEQSPAQLYCTMPRDKANFKNVDRKPLPDLIGELAVNPFLYLRGTVDCDAILRRWFVDIDAAYASVCGPKWDQNMSQYQKTPLSEEQLREARKGVLLWRLWVFASGMVNQDFDFCFDDMFTLDEWKGLSMADGLLAYKEHRNYLDNDCQVVLDILDDCRSHVESGARGAKLRFGHDHVLWPVTAIFNIKGHGETPRTLEDVNKVYVGSNICMAANLQFILYRNARGGVLVKTLLNEQEVLLPCSDSVYCPWEVFEKYVRERVSLFPVLEE